MNSASRVSITLLSLISTSGRAVTGQQYHTFIADPAWVPVRIDSTENDGPGRVPTVLTFRNGHRLYSDIFQVRFLGHLPRPRRAPLLVLGGWECHDCDAPMNVWVIAADSDSGSVSGDHYYYPGSVSGEDSNGPFYKGRAFIGRCLADRQPVVVWFQSERDSLGHWHSAVYRLTARGDSALGEFIRPHPPISVTLEAVQRGDCYEIPGIANFEG